MRSYYCSGNICPLCRNRYSARNTYPVHFGDAFVQANGHQPPPGPIGVDNGEIQAGEIDEANPIHNNVDAPVDMPADVPVDMPADVPVDDEFAAADREIEMPLVEEAGVVNVIDQIARDFQMAFNDEDETQDVDDFEVPLQIDEANPILNNDELPANMPIDDELPAVNREMEMPLVEEAGVANVIDQIALDFEVAFELQMTLAMVDIPEASEARVQPNRAKRATVKLNYEVFTCGVCKKNFHTNDFPSTVDGQPICSFKCFHKI